ncbi:hypothetical protein BDN72DRAFT_900544 [Pluteus cervinus]|uniref:Uncharacterized protein n=1 Tax=Pluteus cervinus TaxID=181527 RepID=A0ACD3AJ25_9AGAR|nr:hypothetical protein BDN72DRAFT_900544 [Pluteus cervinus]
MTWAYRLCAPILPFGFWIGNSQKAVLANVNESDKCGYGKPLLLSVIGRVQEELLHCDGCGNFDGVLVAQPGDASFTLLLGRPGDAVHEPSFDESVQALTLIAKWLDHDRSPDRFSPLKSVYGDYYIWMSRPFLDSQQIFQPLTVVNPTFQPINDVNIASKIVNRDVEAFFTLYHVRTDERILLIAIIEKIRLLMAL